MRTGIDGAAGRQTALLTLLAGLLLVTCQRDPNAPPVGDTEIWRIELEQLDDGVRTLYPRRGTITMELRLNRTRQPDPACANYPNSLFRDITTFVATVEAFESRLQGPTTGSADGSWNCHGMVGTIRLDDGTTYELSTPLNIVPGLIGGFDVAQSSWRSGVRSGVFLMSDIETMGERIRESHVDVFVQNRTDDDWDLALRSPLEITSPLDITYGVYDGRDAFDGTGLQWLPVPAGGTGSLTLPAHPYPRIARLDQDRGLESYVIWIHPSSESRMFDDIPEDFVCVLAPDHPHRLELIIDEDGVVYCGDGWVGRAYMEAARRDLYMLATATPLQDTVSIIYYGFDDQTAIVRVSEPTLTATLDPPQIEFSDTALLTITAMPNVPRNVHDITVEAYLPGNQPLQVIVVPTKVLVWVYELHLIPDSSTLRIPAGTAASTFIRLQQVGFLPSSDILVAALPPPTGFRTSFTSSITDDGYTRFDVRVDRTVLPGEYDLTLCVAAADDPRRPCTYETIKVVVTPAPPPATITGNVRVTQLPLEGVTVRLEQNAATLATTQTDANGNYTFTNLDAGTYTVTISGFPAFAAFPFTSQSVVVNAGQTVTADFVAAYGGN